MRLRIPRESFLDFSISSTLYIIHWGIGAALGGGVVYVVVLVLASGVGADDKD